MNSQLHELVLEALAIGKKQGLNQKAIAEISNLDEVGISRLKKALVQKGELFDFK